MERAKTDTGSLTSIKVEGWLGALSRRVYVFPPIAFDLFGFAHDTVLADEPLRGYLAKTEGFS